MGSSRSTQKTELPEWYQDAAKDAIARANQIYELGRTPYTGVDVVAVNPYEQAASRNVGSMASAFGLAAPAELDMGGMPTVTSGGVTGYSSYPMYVADMERLKEQRPDQYEYFARMTGFDPITGASTNMLPAAGADAAVAPTAPASVSSNDDGPSHVDIMAQHNAMRSVYDEGHQPAGVGLQDSLRRTTSQIPIVGDKVSELFGGPITYDNPTSFGGSGSLVTGAPSKANKDFFASVNKGSNSGGLFSGLKGLFGG